MRVLDTLVNRTDTEVILINFPPCDFHVAKFTCPTRHVWTNIRMYAWAAVRACSRGVARADSVASVTWPALASSLSRTEPPGSSMGRCRGSRADRMLSNWQSPSCKTFGSWDKVCQEEK